MIVLEDKRGYIYLAKSTKDIFYTKIHFNFPGWDRNDLVDILRPYKVLFEKEPFFYNKSSLEFFEKNKKVKKSTEFGKTKLNPLEKNEVDVLFSSFLNSLYYLKKLDYCPIQFTPLCEKLEKAKRLVKYSCDVKNIFYNILGSRLGKAVIKLTSELREKDFKDALDEFLKIKNKEDKITFLEENNLNEFLPFINSSFRMEIEIFNNRPAANDSEILTPLFKKEDVLFTDKSLPSKLKEEIYLAFQIGEIVTGDTIRERLYKIWDDLGLEGKPKLKVIFNYFNTNIQRSGYKLLTKKEEV